MYSYNPKSVLPPTGQVTGSANVVDNVDIVVTAAAAFVAGDVVALPVPTTIATSGDTSTVIGITTQSAQASAATTSNADMRDSGGRKVFGVVLDASVASGALMKVRVRGVVAANLASNSQTGYPKTVTASKQLGDVGSHSSNTKSVQILAYSLEGSTGIKYVYFDGSGGLGCIATA